MSNAEQDDDRTYVVVINDEEQYSIWLAHKPIPNGWRAVGPQGKKAECLDYIEKNWTDMRPASLRRFMEENAQQKK
jgi:MbtH protein